MRSLILKAAVQAAHEAEAEAIEKAHYNGTRMSRRQRRDAGMTSAKRTNATDQRIVAGNLRRKGSGKAWGNGGEVLGTPKSRQNLLDFRRRIIANGTPLENLKEARMRRLKQSRQEGW